MHPLIEPSDVAADTPSPPFSKAALCLDGTLWTGANCCNNIRKLLPEDVNNVFDDERLILMGQTNVEMIRFVTKRIQAIENQILKERCEEGSRNVF
jgi:hypothetical protein